MHFSARLFLGILLALFSFAFLVHPAHAQTYTSNTDANVPHNLHTYTQSVFLELLSTAGCQLGGIDVNNPQTPCLSYNKDTHTIGYNTHQNGLIGSLISMTTVLYTPPVHLSQYTQDLASHFGIAKSAYAQGVGFEGINPILPIWKSFRNIVYLMFVIIFVLVGFGIMFRFNIDPRTVMSIENQLPKLVIGLVLVTFSFAIAGLLVDAMWLVTFLVINILTSVDVQMLGKDGITASQATGNVFQNPIGAFNNLAPGGFMGVAVGAGGSIGEVIRNLFSDNNAGQLGLLATGGSSCSDVGSCLQAFFTNVVLTDVGSILSILLSWVIAGLGTIVVLVVLFAAFFKLWFSLLISYAYILIDIVLGPFFIVFGVFPNSKIGFTTWLKDLLANLLAFPAVLGTFLLGRLFIDGFTMDKKLPFVPPLIGNPSANSANDALGFLIGLAIMFLAPTVPAMVKALLQVEENKFAAGIGQTVGAGVGLLVGAVKGGIRTKMQGDEWIIGRNGQYEQRGLGKAFAGNVTS